MALIQKKDSILEEINNWVKIIMISFNPKSIISQNDSTKSIFQNWAANKSFKECSSALKSKEFT